MFILREKNILYITRITEYGNGKNTLRSAAFPFYYPLLYMNEKEAQIISIRNVSANPLETVIATYSLFPLVTIF